MKISVQPEGREGVYLPDRESLKAWIVDKGFEYIHSYIDGGPFVIGADHDPASVLDDIDSGERLAILTGDAARGNLGHALAIIRNNKLEMYDIGEVTKDDLDLEASMIEQTDNNAPLRVGDVLYGFCGGWFGRDSYGDKRVEAIGADWVVVRDDTGAPQFASESSGWSIDTLCEYRSRVTL